MGNRALRWLYDELPRMVAGGVIDEAAAERIRRHYGPVTAVSATHRLLVVFGLLGGLLIGSGIVLLLAHNWDDLGRPARAALALGLLIAGQALAGWTLWCRRDSVAWIEGAGVLLTLVIGAAIALISQTYQMPGDLERFLLITIGLALPGVYLLRSRGALMLVSIGIVTWLLSGPWGVLPVGRLAWFAGLVGATMPFAVHLYRHHPLEIRTAWFGWIASACVTLSFVRLTAGLGNLWIPFYAGLLASIYVLGSRLTERSDPAPAWRRPFHAYGALGCGVLLLILSFREVWQESHSSASLADPTLLAVGAICVALTAHALLGAARLVRTRAWYRAMLAGLPLVVTLGWALGTGSRAIWITTALMNVYGLALGLAICIEGMRRGLLGTANGGLALILALLSLRFLDADLSFVLRGVAFIVLGAAFLAVNVLIFRRRGEVQS